MYVNRNIIAVNNVLFSKLELERVEMPARVRMTELATTTLEFGVDAELS